MKIPKFHAALVLLPLFLLAGCGSPKADVPIFIMMDQNTLKHDPSQELQQTFQANIGQSPSVTVAVSPVFSKAKLNFEIASADDAIYVVPQAQFLDYATTGSLVALDDTFDPALYPNEVVAAAAEGTAAAAPEKHLYGIPVEQLHWMEPAGYSSAHLIAFVHPRAKHPELAKQVLKQLSKSRP